MLRGKWVMEVLLGTPPPPPPPNVPDLEATAEAEDGRLRTVRERLEQHRASPRARRATMIDPIGLALENFDVTGAWRIKDNGIARGRGEHALRRHAAHGSRRSAAALLKRSTVLVRTFTENLMTYALGRRLDAADMPTVRAHRPRGGAAADTLSAFVLGIVKSPAFRMKSADVRPVS